MSLDADPPFDWVAPTIGAAYLATVAVMYAVGWRRYHRRLPGRFGVWQLTAFLSGLACLGVAIVSPLEEAADGLLSAHMVQHILLISVAPALLMLGEPLVPLLYGLPDSPRRGVVARLRWRSLRRVMHGLAHPLVALLLSSLILWSWHLPSPYQFALRVPVAHLVEHASLVVAGFLFWYPVVQPWPSRSRWPRGAIIPYLLAADVQNTVVAAVLTFSDRVLYPFYEFQGRVTEAAALDDQVLAGVIMWVPMSFAYLVPAALLTIRLLSPRRSGTTGRACGPIESGIMSLGLGVDAGAICRSIGMARNSKKR